MCIYKYEIFKQLNVFSEQTTNEFLNANWKPASESLNAVLSATIESVIFNMLKTVFDQIPADFWVDDIAVPV